MSVGAAQQADEPVEALGLKMLNESPGVTNVSFAGYRQCPTDSLGGDIHL